MALSNLLPWSNVARIILLYCHFANLKCSLQSIEHPFPREYGLFLIVVQMFVTVLFLFCQALQDKVHSKIFRTKRPKAYVNGISDRTQKKLAFYFKPLPKSLPSPRQHHTTAHTVQLYGSCAQKVYQDVDNEVCIVYYWLNSINDLLGSSNEHPLWIIGSRMPYTWNCTTQIIFTRCLHLSNRSLDDAPRRLTLD